MLRWSLEEIIDAVHAEIDPPSGGTVSLKPVRLYAFTKLALGKPEGRAPPVQEDFLLRLIRRVQYAIEKGLDPIESYQVALPDEVPRHRLSSAYERDASMFNVIDDHLRNGADLATAVMYGFFGEERENRTPKG